MDIHVRVLAGVEFYGNIRCDIDLVLSQWRPRRRRDCFFFGARRRAGVGAGKITRVAVDSGAAALDLYFQPVLLVVQSFTWSKGQSVVAVAAQQYLVQTLIKIIGVINSNAAGVF